VLAAVDGVAGTAGMYLLGIAGTVLAGLAAALLARRVRAGMATLVVEDRIAEAVVHAIVDAARSGNESGDGLVWTTVVENVTHNRTGRSLKEVEVG